MIIFCCFPNIINCQHVTHCDQMGDILIETLQHLHCTTVCSNILQIFRQLFTGRKAAQSKSKAAKKYKGATDDESESNEEDEVRQTKTVTKKKPVLQLSSDDDSDFDIPAPPPGRCNCLFIHPRYFYSTSSSPLLLRGAPDYSTVNTPKCYRERLAQGPYVAARACDLPDARHQTYQ